MKRSICRCQYYDATYIEPCMQCQGLRFSPQHMDVYNADIDRYRRLKKDLSMKDIFKKNKIVTNEEKKKERKTEKKMVMNQVEVKNVVTHVLMVNKQHHKIELCEACEK